MNRVTNSLYCVGVVCFLDHTHVFMWNDVRYFVQQKLCRLLASFQVGDEGTWFQISAHIHISYSDYKVQ